MKFNESQTVLIWWLPCFGLMVCQNSLFGCDRELWYQSLNIGDDYGGIKVSSGCVFGDLNGSKCADDVACGRGLTLVEFGDMVPKLCRF